MKHIKSFEKYEPREYNESLAGMETDINQAIKNASKLVGKELSDKDVIPELRDKIEQSLESGDNDLADKLTDIKMELEPLLK